MRHEARRACARFLLARVYRHPRVDAHHGRGREAWSATYSRATATDPEALPPEWRDQAPPPGTRGYARHVADFIAGMTDRFALAEHRRLFDATPDLR